MLKLEVLLTVYNKGADLLYEMHLCGYRLQCVCLPRVVRRSTAAHSVTLSLVGIAYCVVESCRVVLPS